MEVVFSLVYVAEGSRALKPNIITYLLIHYLPPTYQMLPNYEPAEV